ncbi:MAG: ribokinase [Xylanivirga thermophila]|uniref:ribokinase n=1 Tax=Xylanivirga thermophila TaxID=2496273 RepID=UPI00101CC44E|nr:ribokinase [Xylanivirga thermophila]
MDIVVVGSINMDYTTKVTELPRRGETIMSKFFTTASGGKGANQAVAASRLGADVFMVGAVGNDLAGQTLLKRLKDEGIDTKGIYKSDFPSGNAMITVDDNGSNTIVVYPGANQSVSCEKVEAFANVLEGAKVVIVQLEIPLDTVEYTIKRANEMGTKVILNPAPAATLPNELYKSVDIITPNETELESLTGISDIEKGAKTLLDLGVKKVLVTLGSKGCFYMDDNESFYMEPFKVKAVDTTAAGDSFNGALAVAMVEGMGIKEGIRFANGVGGLTTTKLGAQDSLPYREEVDKMLKD